MLYFSRKLLLLSVVLFVALFAVAQSKEQCLRDKILTEQTDTGRAYLLGQLAWNIKFSDPDEAFRLADEEIKLAEKHKHFGYIADGYRTKGFILVVQSKLVDGLSMYNLALQYARKAGNKVEEASCLSLVAGMYQDKGDYDQALSYYLHGLKVARRTSDHNMIAILYNNTASLLAEAGRPASQSLPYFHKALMHDTLVKKRSFAGMISINIAADYHRAGNKPMSELYIKKAINYAEREGSGRYNYATINYEIGNIYLESGKYKEAEEYLTGSLRVLDSLQMPDNSLRPLLALSKLYIKQHTIDKAEVCAKRLLKEAIKQQAKFYIGEAYKVLSQIERSRKSYQQALVYYEMYNQWNDSVFNETKERSIANVQAQGLLKQKELEMRLNVKQQLRENDILKMSNKNLRNERIIAFGVAITFLILGIFIYTAYAAKRKQNKQLEKQQLIIQNQSVEKDVLIREIHHRVKNNLQIVSSLLNLQANSVSDASALEALRESHNRVKTISIIHQKLYSFDELSVILLEDYIQQLWSHLRKVYNAGHIDVRLNILPKGLMLDMEKAIPIGLIVNELITNTVKYAFTEHDQDAHIDISCSDNGDGFYTLTVADNGKGMPEGFDPATSPNLGYRIMNELSRQLKGTAKFSTTSGTCFTLVFPYSGHPERSADYDFMVK